MNGGQSAALLSFYVSGDLDSLLIQSRGTKTRKILRRGGQYTRDLLVENGSYRNMLETGEKKFYDREGSSSFNCVVFLQGWV